MRTPLIAGNWKMFKTVRESVAFVTDLRTRIGEVTGVDIVVAPTFPALHAVAAALDGKGLPVANAGGFRDWQAAGLPTRSVVAEKK